MSYQLFIVGLLNLGSMDHYGVQGVCEDQLKINIYIHNTALVPNNSSPLKEITEMYPDTA